MTAALLWLAHALLALAFLALQVLDVISTNAALRRPNVVEVGDEAIGLGNLVGWAMKRWGRWWWLVKIPLVLIFAPLIVTPAPVSIEPALILLLIAANSYFLKLVRENFRNARYRPMESDDDARVCRSFSER